MESALYGIFTLVGFVSEISLVRCAHSFDFRYFTNSCENPVRTRFPWSNLYVLFHREENKQAAEEIHSFPSLKLSKHEIGWKQHTTFLNRARDD